MFCSLFPFYMSDIWARSQENQSDRITSCLGFSVCSRLLSFTLLLISLSCFLLASWLHRSPANRPLPAWCPSSRCPPGRWHQTPPCPTSLPLANLTRHTHISPVFCPSLTHCVHHLLPSYTSLVSLCPPACLLPPLLLPSSPGPRRADKAPDYLCFAASVLWSD